MCTILACCACIIRVCLAAHILHSNVLWDSPRPLSSVMGSVGAGSPGGMFTEINGVNICCNCQILGPHPAPESRQGWQKGSHVPPAHRLPMALHFLLIVAQFSTHASHRKTLTPGSKILYFQWEIYSVSTDLFRVW